MFEQLEAYAKPWVHNNPKYSVTIRRNANTDSAELTISHEGREYKRTVPIASVLDVRMSKRATWLVGILDEMKSQLDKEVLIVI